eukprot:9476063-Pyramimonas_sp.AAC.2
MFTGPERAVAMWGHAGLKPARNTALELSQLRPPQVRGCYTKELAGGVARGLYSPKVLHEGSNHQR